jgi:hypothetical protein
MAVFLYAKKDLYIDVLSSGQMRLIGYLTPFPEYLFTILGPRLLFLSLGIGVEARCQRVGKSAMGWRCHPALWAFCAALVYSALKHAAYYLLFCNSIEWDVNLWRAQLEVLLFATLKGFLLTTTEIFTVISLGVLIGTVSAQRDSRQLGTASTTAPIPRRGARKGSMWLLYACVTSVAVYDVLLSALHRATPSLVIPRLILYPDHVQEWVVHDGQDLALLKTAQGVLAYDVPCTVGAVLCVALAAAMPLALRCIRRAGADGNQSKGRGQPHAS